ncbi:MAG: TIGR00282 family metallophosphoesterase [Verrucomicrobiaceae bacterium]
MIPGNKSSETASNTIRILFLGDVMGEPGRKAVAALLPVLKEELAVDFIIVNGENSAGGRGITPKIAISLMRAGAAVITTGDHVWDQKDIIPFFAEEPRLLRPLNYPEGTPGKGWVILETKKGKVGVINLQGRTFMKMLLDNPFEVIGAAVDEIRKETNVIFIDMHAETTSEKTALAWLLNGRVSAIVGTHTHVQTADERILPDGTAFLCDAGMCGPLHSVIGMDVDAALQRLLTLLPSKHYVAQGPVQVCGAWVDVDVETGKAIRIERVQRIWSEEEKEDAG